MEQKVIISGGNLCQLVEEAVAEAKADRIIVLTDEATRQLCWPKVSGYACLADARHITIPAGDEHKTLTTLASVWEQMQQHGATRHSLLITLGGGMVTDLGGFAAATFKRGVSLLNIPTTLLAMVDASVGGKTGINFGGLKNEIGAFRPADSVIIDTVFLTTLDHNNILSGFAEMLKHALISSDDMLVQHLRYDLDNPDLALLATMVGQSVAVKQHIVTEDPFERGLRKALNLGHTVGHAFEALALSRQTPVLHGYAVAWGLVCELYLSAILAGFPTERMHQIARFVRDNYGRFAITCDDYPELLRLMRHDKKNTGAQINFTLLSSVGDIRINQTASDEDILAALDFYREGN